MIKINLPIVNEEVDEENCDVTRNGDSGCTHEKEIKEKPYPAYSNQKSLFYKSSIVAHGLAFCQQIELITELEVEDVMCSKNKHHYIYHHHQGVCFGEISGYGKIKRDKQFAEEDDSSNDSDDDDDDDDNDEENDDNNFENDDDGNENGDNYSQRYSPTTSKKRKFVKLSEQDLEENWYAVLNLEQEEAADEEQIKAAYRRRCLETHPDKQSNHSDELFKKVQKAFDILSDPETRLSYDSSRPFDDSIPPDNAVDTEQFYSTFGPVFARNKKWSVDKSLPSLGNDHTPFKEVLRFYDQWATYQTWRDFSHLVDLEEIHDDMCREEKRFYMRENERLISQHRKDELKRIRLLMERARKNDPRLLRKKKEIEAKKLKEQQEREAFREKLRKEHEEQRAAAEAEEKKREEEELRRKQEAKESIKTAMRSVVEFLKTHNLLDEIPANKLFDNAVRKVNINWLFLKFSGREDAQEVANAITTANINSVPISEIQEYVRSNQLLSAKLSSVSEERYRNEVEESEDKKVIPAVYIFNCFVLAEENKTGINRYGEAIKRVDSANVSMKTTSSSKKDESAVNRGRSNQSVVEWLEEDLSRLQKATAKFPPGTVERWSKICVLLRHKFTEEEAMAKVNEINAALHSAGHHSNEDKHGASNLSNKESTCNAPLDEMKKAGGPVANDAKMTVVTAQSVDDWTMKQQKQLENGLRELKEYKEKDKFQKIAKLVEGKTAKECFERFKYLCSIKKKN